MDRLFVALLGSTLFLGCTPFHESTRATVHPTLDRETPIRNYEVRLCVVKTKRQPAGASLWVEGRRNPELMAAIDIDIDGDPVDALDGRATVVVEGPWTRKNKGRQCSRPHVLTVEANGFTEDADTASLELLFEFGCSISESLGTCDPEISISEV